MSTSPSESEKAAEERAHARVGSTVDGKWHLDALLGLGGMAAVYKGTHRNGTRAAVKILHPEVAANTTLKTRFLREGYVANKVEHPNVVRILDDDEAPDGTVYLVMELLDGESLQDVVVRQRTLSENEVLRVAHEVLDALEAAHAKDIIHRDLKPGNLLRLADGTVKLLDFGVAKVRESSAQMPNATTLAALGTPGFMPPEQARGRWDSVDARADIWALGATMFALATGRFVHEEETTNEQLLAAMTKPAPPVREVCPDAGEDFARIVERALAFDRENRYQSAAEMKRAIADALRERGASVPPTKIAADSTRVVIEVKGREGARDSSKNVPEDFVEAKTLDAPLTDGAAVVERRRSEAPGRRGLTPTQLIALAGLVAALAVTAFIMRTRTGAKVEESAGATTSTSPSTPATVSTSIATSEPTTMAPPPSVEAPSASASASSAPPIVRTAPHAAGPIVRPVASASAHPSATQAVTPPPSASVDIFNRRR